MTLPSQFSLEEENFYKDIQDLLKNSSQNEKELSSFLQRYMGLLAKADLDDESLIINFTKAGLIIEASAKVYGTKVDRLWNNLEHILLSLRNKSHGQSKNKTLGGEEMGEMEGDDSRRRLSVNGRRRKKVGDALVSPDDFLEIDNITGLLGKNMNEHVNKSPGSLKFCEKVPNMFIKNKQRKKKIDVCLSKNVEEKDIIRLRDWIISTECLLVKEIYTSLQDNSTNDISNESFGLRCEEINPTVCNETAPGESENAGKETVDTSRVESVMTGTSKEDLKDQSLNKEMEAESDKSLKEATFNYIIHPAKDTDFQIDKDSIENDLNISKESDLAKFPNVLGRGPKACLVDVDEVFWDIQKFQDMIPNRKMRSGRGYRTSNPPCKLCRKKEVHQGRKLGKRCINKKRKDSGLDSYFIPHVQPTIGEPQFGILPDEELISTFKQENKIIEQLAKLNAAKNINEAFHPNENPEELKNFLGFDGFEKRFLRISECNEGEIEPDFEGNNLDEEREFADNPPPGDDFELPVPVTVDSVRHKSMRIDCAQDPKDDDRLVESEYQKLLKEGLKDHYEAKSIFAKNKELGIKISKWHEMISDKIRLSEERGAMNMKSLAEKIMSSFSKPIIGELPRMSFRELVKSQCQRDVPRYFFGCLQLTNEGNLDITRTDPRPLATDCMLITQLRPTRKNCDLDESTAKTPSKEAKTSDVNRKRNSLMRSPVSFENKSPSKTKRVKQRTEKACKRQKNFTALNSSKKIRSGLVSISTVARSIQTDRSICSSTPPYGCTNTRNKHKEKFRFSTDQLQELNENENEIQFDVPLNEDEKGKAENPKRPKKTVTLESDFFQEIDISIGLSGEIVTESPDENPKKLKFYNNVFKIFLRNKRKKKEIAGEEKIIRLREWILTAECLLVKEICAFVPEYYEENEDHGKKDVFIREGVIIDSLGVRPKPSRIISVKPKGNTESNLVPFSDSIREREMHEIHTYADKPYPNCISESVISREQNPSPPVFIIPEDNDPGDINTMRLMMKIASKRQENFTTPGHQKKVKF